MRFLNIGGPVALAVVGAILYFAINVESSGFDISVIGLILMLAAAIWFVVGIVTAAILSSREKTVVHEEPVRHRTIVDE